MAPMSKKRGRGGPEASSVTSGTSNDCSDSNLDSGDFYGGNLSEGEGRQYARVNRVVLDKNSDEYRRRRARNNVAVKKSRTKSKIKTFQTLERVNQLKEENEQLQQKISILSKELRLLKEIFVAHANNAHGTVITEGDLDLLTCPEAIEASLPRREGFDQDTN